MSFTRNNYTVLESFTDPNGREYAKVLWKGIESTGYISRISGPGRTITEEWYKDKKRENKVNWDVTINTGPEAGGYAEELIYEKDEPDDDYLPPIDNPLPGKGYLLENYPVRERVETLTEITENNLPDYDVFTWGVYSILISEGGVIESSGWRFINHTSDLPLAEPAFLTMLEEIRNAVNSSPGTEVMITKTRCVFFKYE